MYPNPGDPVAGIFIHHQVRHLTQAGCEVMVVSPKPYVPKVLAGRYKSYAQIPRENEFEGIHVVHPRYIRPPGWIFHAPSCYSMFHSVRKLMVDLIRDFQPHILHAHTATPDGYAGLLLKRNFKIPLVVSLRGSDVNVYPHRDRWTLRLTRRVISGADKLTAVSGALKEMAEKIAKPQREIAVIYTGCELSHFSFDPEARVAFRKRVGIPQESPVLIFVGHVLKAKGIFELLESFLIVRKSYPDLHLLVVGDGEDFREFAAQVKASEVEEWVHLLGARPHDEIPGWFSASDILVLPSWREGLPNVVVEAMACRRPVIATRVGGIPEAVIDGESGILVNKQDPKALAEAIAFLIENEGKRWLMGAKGRVIVEERFTWEKNAAETIKVYEEVLGAR